MHALPFVSTGGGDGSLTRAFFRAAEGDDDAFPLWLESGETDVTFFVRFFLAEVLGALGDVDMSRSGS